ncbi:FAD dependent oxidoreductase [Catenovulum agarivorans DS-2]|uniref:FAD dependent oxidoreductase n=1 Tax=Catenovulum agarivorans DS-2 TaxID=1328313 RepID=W7QBM4_9ALTE|nr:FAD-dependent oxidoreductase [Catenovulum agarivorans]EWH10219.1 FAD dependent oxidoreductase [Catenovulum agarivorans DS-2]
MLVESFSPQTRTNNKQNISTDFVVAGGGLAGVCAAIAAARNGSKVVLIQDRPVLGGNASSEVRVWALGATSHMGNNNRWSREGGIIDEIMLENLKVNKDGNPIIFDAVLLDKVAAEPNIQLLLNTAVYQVNKSSERKIDSVVAFCSQNSTEYSVSAPLFCDATGDGLVAFNAGASFRIGAESRDEFGEQLAPEQANDQLLGHTLFFYSKKLDHPVKYTPPKFAYSHEQIGAMPRCKNIQGSDSGIKFWWIEYGGIHNTIAQTEEIKWELWKIVYGIWDYIKNSGKFDDVENLTLEWIGTVPGKRESRRFNGEYMLKQQDIVEQTQFADAVSYGGWAIDIHPSEGIYSDKPACSQFHSKGVYQIPYRCFISKDIDNLFFAGRNISASHMAYGSSRVMITCAHGGQAVGTAAALCKQYKVSAKAMLQPEYMQSLQQQLNRFGHGIPNVPLAQQGNLAKQAHISASSELELKQLLPSGKYMPLTQACAQLMPFNQGTAPVMKLQVKAQTETQLKVALRVSEKAENYTPEISLKTIELNLVAGEQIIKLDFSDVAIDEQYGFVTFYPNSAVELALSDQLVTGFMPVFNKVHKAVSNTGKQTMPADSGIESFEFWTPERRPKGQNLALEFESALKVHPLSHVTNGYLRPWRQTNAWAASFGDNQPHIKFCWPAPVTISQITLFFDTDADHALETVLMQHPESEMPYCVQNYRIKLADGTLLLDVVDNYQTVNQFELQQPVTLDQLIVEFDHPSKLVPASLFQIEIY